MTNWKSSILIPAVLALMWIVPGASAQPPQPPTNSVPSSLKSDTPAKRNKIPIGNVGTSACTDATASGSNAGAHDRDAVGSSAAGKGACVPTEERVFGACAAAADELKASRVLIGALERENGLLKERIETGKQLTDGLTELNRTRKSEAEALRTAVAAKNETIAAKDTVITAQDKLIETLKRKKNSPWQRIGDVMIGVAAAMIIR